MKITQGTRVTTVGDIDKFTGSVYVDTIQNPGTNSRLSCGHVWFAPGARTAWHSHPRGQMLYVTDGMGRVGKRSGEVTEIQAGSSTSLHH